MFGLPQQNIKGALDDLQKAINLKPNHISWYQLTIEPNTWFANKPPKLPASDLIYDMQHSGIELLRKNDYKQYEISAFAQEGFKCQHNLNYWHFGDYLGLGAGAHSKLSFNLPEKVLRCMKNKNPVSYVKLRSSEKPIQTTSRLKAQDLIFEFMLNALRLKNGFEPQLFTARTGLDISRISAQLKKAQKMGLLEQNLLRIKPTTLGYDFLNDLVNIFNYEK